MFYSISDFFRWEWWRPRVNLGAQFESENNCDFPEKLLSLSALLCIIPAWLVVTGYFFMRAGIELKVVDKHQLQTRADCLLLHFIGWSSYCISQILIKLGPIKAINDQHSMWVARYRLLTTDGNTERHQTTAIGSTPFHVWCVVSCELASNGQLCPADVILCLLLKSTTTSMFRWTGPTLIRSAQVKFEVHRQEVWKNIYPR